MNVIILSSLSSKQSKAIIGFSTNIKEFIKEWLKSRPQFIDHIYSERACLFRYNIPSKTEYTHKIYGSPLIDKETCHININDNCGGFNDNH